MLKQAEKTRRIILVDDEHDFHMVMRYWVTPDYQILSLFSGEGLLDELCEAAPDLLILDVRLPGNDGFELCRRIRKDERFDSLPIIFLTASHSDKDFLTGFEAGGTAYLTKPITRTEFLEKVGRLLDDEGY